MVVPAPREQAAYAARFEVRSGDDYGGWSGERAQLAGGSSTVETEGSNDWYSFDIYLPSDFQDSESSFQVFMEWHHSGTCCSPPVTFQDINGRYVVRVVRSNDSTKGNNWDQFDLGPAPRGAWTDFVVHFAWSSNPATAAIDVRRNGVLVQRIRHHPTLFSGFTNYLIAGWYRDPQPLTQVVYEDGIRRGPRWASVAR